MVLLNEQERLLADEENSASSTGQTAFGTGAITTIKNLGNVVAPKAEFIAWRFEVYRSTAGTTLYQVRLTVGGLIIFGTGAPIAIGAATTHSFSGIVYVAAGTYAVLIEGAADNANAYVRNAYVGLVNFNDVVGSGLAAYAAPIAKTTVIRTTPIGTLAYTTLYVQVGATTPGQVTNMENVGDDALTYGVKLSIDGVQVDWTERYQDTGGTSNAASGKYVAVLTAGVEHTITITKDDVSTVVNIAVALCPWLLTSAVSFPVTALSFPQGSTLYVQQEPICVDVTKFIGVGKVRACTFGDAMDYYDYDSAAGIQNFSYAFEFSPVASTLVKASGLGGCIGNIGVDAK